MRATTRSISIVLAVLVLVGLVAVAAREAEVGPGQETNLVSSFHVIGEIFDWVYPEGAIGREPLRNVQTTLVPAGGAAIVEFAVEMPGRYLLVDHSLSRAMEKGALGALMVAGAATPGLFKSLDPPDRADRPSGH